MFVRLASVRSGRRAVASVVVMALCSVVLDVRRHPKAWSPYMSNVVPHMHLVAWAIIGSRSVR